MEFNKPVEVGKSQLGELGGDIAALLCYLFPPIAGLIFFFTEKENDFVRFAAMQSIVIGVIGIILSAITCGFGYILILIVQVLGIVKSVQKQNFKCPLVAGISEKWAAKPGATPPPPPAA
jgi:uncharacterized membrane protein